MRDTKNSSRKDGCWGIRGLHFKKTKKPLGQNDHSPRHIRDTVNGWHKD